MSGYTPNLNLFEYNPTTDGNQTFNIKNVLNDNFDKIDTYCKGLSDDKADTDDVNTALALKADKTVLHALKGYSDNGELLTDVEGLTDVKNYAHSTFDRSKFTVVGTPNITKDGIASGFSSSDYVSIQNLSFSQPFVFEFTEKVASKMSGCIGANAFNVQPNSSVTAVYFLLFSIGGGTLSANYNFLEENNVTYRVSWDGSIYKLEMKGDLVKTTWQTILTYTSSSSLTGTSLILGYNSNSAIVSLGSYDLKQIQMYSNGVPVFLGNKTGIDTIKPDDYTIPSGVTTPTITDDGILTFADSTHYITTSSTINLASGSTWDIICSVKPKTSTLSNICGIALEVGSKLIYAISTSRRPSVFWNIGGSNVSFSSNSALPLNQKTYLKLHFEGTSMQLFSSTDKKNWSSMGGNASTSNTTANGVLKIAGGYSTYGITTNEIEMDLNDYEVYLNGNLVYQPCLKIPYTKGSEQYGGKYVNAQYLPRVKDAYEQGLANDYFTLDEVNGTYTLPMGNLYGYIEKRARDIAHPIAVPFFRLTDEINEDEVRLEGAEVDKGLYLAIEQKLAAYCTASEDTTKIILPNFIGRVPWGANSQGYIEAGLPNITGQYTQRGQSQGGNGVFYSSGGTSGRYKLEDGWSEGWCFDASRSSTIYKNDVTTVQPPAFKVRWLARWK